MTPEELDAMNTQALFDYLFLKTDAELAPVITRLEERWLLASSAAKLWFAQTADEMKRERAKLDELARVQEGYVD